MNPGKHQRNKKDATTVYNEQNHKATNFVVFHNHSPMLTLLSHMLD